MGSHCLSIYVESIDYWNEGDLFQIYVFARCSSLIVELSCKGRPDQQKAFPCCTSPYRRDKPTHIIDTDRFSTHDIYFMMRLSGQWSPSFASIAWQPKHLLYQPFRRILCLLKTIERLAAKENLAAVNWEYKPWIVIIKHVASLALLLLESIIAACLFMAQCLLPPLTLLHNASRKS